MLTNAMTWKDIYWKKDICYLIFFIHLKTTFYINFYVRYKIGFVSYGYIKRECGCFTDYFSDIHKNVENKHYIKGYLVISPLIKIRHDIERCFCITNLAFDKNIVSYISNNYVFVNLK